MATQSEGGVNFIPVYLPVNIPITPAIAGT